jgi:hypothetical protein
LGSGHLYGHLRAKRIVIRENGIEIVQTKKHQLIEWGLIANFKEKRRYGGGLTIALKNDRRIFIPFEVKEYKEIRNYIVQMNRNIVSEERISG